MTDDDTPSSIVDLEGADLPPLVVGEIPGFLKFMPPVIQEAARQGAQFRLDPADWSLMLDGFYKNGPLKIAISATGDISATDRRDRVTHIAHFDDLVLLNFQWWRASNTKTVYTVPQRPWLDSFIQKKWVKRKVIFEPADESQD